MLWGQLTGRANDHTAEKGRLHSRGTWAQVGPPASEEQEALCCQGGQAPDAAVWKGGREAEVLVLGAAQRYE